VECAVRGVVSQAQEPAAPGRVTLGHGTPGTVPGAPGSGSNHVAALCCGDTARPPCRGSLRTERAVPCAPKIHSPRADPFRPRSLSSWWQGRSRVVPGQRLRVREQGGGRAGGGGGGSWRRAARAALLRVPAVGELARHQGRVPARAGRRGQGRPRAQQDLHHARAVLRDGAHPARAETTSAWWVGPQHGPSWAAPRVADARAEDVLRGHHGRGGGRLRGRALRRREPLAEHVGPLARRHAAGPPLAVALRGHDGVDRHPGDLHLAPLLPKLLHQRAGRYHLGLRAGGLPGLHRVRAQL